MAEIVGLAASVAGLVAITGQIGKSILFIKVFLEDTKNAPEEVRSLAAEIELLGSAAEKTDSLLVKCHADGIEIDLEEERKGLTRYADMIERLKEKIEKDVKAFGAGKGRWWERVGSATRKKSVEGYLVGVERAKTLVMGIETKIMIQLQHKHRDSLLTTVQTLEAVQLLTDRNTTTLNAVERQTTQITNWTGTTDQTLEALQVSTDGNTTTLNMVETQTSHITNWTGTTDQTLASLSNGVQQINTSINTLMPAMQNLQNQTSRPSELSALESMLESAVMRGLKRHNEELQKTTQHSPVHSPLSETAPEYHDTPTENTNEQLYSGSYAMIRRDKTVCRTAFRTPLFDIEIETREAQRTPKPKKGIPLHELSRLKPTHSQRFTNYHVRVKIPFWRGGMTFQSGNAGMMYGGNLCKTFRTYNFVLGDAPIIKACEKFDLPQVRRMFEAGLASPLDFDYDLRQSLVDTVVCRISYHANDESLRCAIALLKYLICCLAGDIGHVSKLSRIFESVSFGISAQKHWADLAEICRLGITHSSEDPFKQVEFYLDIKLSTTPLYQLLVGQDKWWFDDMIKFRNPSAQNYWYETDLQMLRDPKASTLQTAISNGFLYRPYHKIYGSLCNRDGCVHMLLAIAANNMEEKFHKCVLSRLVILLNNGIDPRKVVLIHRRDSQTMSSMDRPLSCTEYAIQLSLTDLWRAALEEAGWSHADIDGIFDEDLLQATVGLLNGEIQYQFRDDQRRDFIQNLRQGRFVDLEGDTLFDISERWGSELGISWHYIKNMICDVASVFKTLKTPGSWPHEQSVSLMPGKDFELPSYYPFNYCFEESNAVQNWKCIRDIWENELGGCIPDGYEDIEDSDTIDDDDDEYEQESEMSLDDYAASEVQ